MTASDRQYVAGLLRDALEGRVVVYDGLPGPTVPAIMYEVGYGELVDAWLAIGFRVSRVGGTVDSAQLSCVPDDAL